MNIKSRIDNLRENIKEYNPELVLVTKYAQDEDVRKAYKYGERNFGENYIQNLVKKASEFPEDVKWHFLGHIQTNKIKLLSSVPNLSCIHSIDSIRVVKKIENTFNRKIDAFIEINLSGDESKTGIKESELFNFLDELVKIDIKHLNFIGLMTISPLHGNDDDKEKCFLKLNNLLKTINLKYENSRLSLKELSMGMTDDYKIALKNGATYIRIGSLIFN